jgi:hypothetical protein
MKCYIYITCNEEILHLYTIHVRNLTRLAYLFPKKEIPIFSFYNGFVKLANWMKNQSKNKKWSCKKNLISVRILYIGLNAALPRETLMNGTPCISRLVLLLLSALGRAWTRRCSHSCLLEMHDGFLVVGRVDCICEDGPFPVFASCVKISNPDSLFQ